jgi:hypothetical protein
MLAWQGRPGRANGEKKTTGLTTGGFLVSIDDAYQ